MICIEEEKEPRRKYYNGLTSTPKFKNGGVKKVLVLGVIPEGKEEPEILEDFLSKLNLEPGSFQFCPDLKLINIAVGIGTHASTHPSPFCDWIKNSRQKCNLRTFESIIKNCKAWKKAGAKSSDAKKFQNCIRFPLKIFPKTGLVILYIPLPQLHIKMGVVNKLFKELEREFPQAIQWAQQIHVVKEDYHKQFEGMLNPQRRMRIVFFRIAQAKMHLINFILEYFQTNMGDI